jgi:hypothetical protein
MQNQLEKAAVEPEAIWSNPTRSKRAAQSKQRPDENCEAGTP